MWRGRRGGRTVLWAILYAKAILCYVGGTVADFLSGLGGNCFQWHPFRREVNWNRYATPTGDDLSSPPQWMHLWYWPLVQSLECRVSSEANLVAMWWRLQGRCCYCWCLKWTASKWALSLKPHHPQWGGGRGRKRGKREGDGGRGDTEEDEKQR